MKKNEELDVTVHFGGLELKGILGLPPDRTAASSYSPMEAEAADESPQSIRGRNSSGYRYCNPAD